MQSLLGEEPVDVLESFELEGVAGWVFEEHGALLARETGKSEVRSNLKLDLCFLHSVSQLGELVPLHHNSKVRNWNTHSVHWIAHRVRIATIRV